MIESAGTTSAKVSLLFVFFTSQDQHQKIQELERILRLHEVEIARMKQDYQKLTDILQTNITKAIYQTFVGQD